MAEQTIGAVDSRVISRKIAKARGLEWYFTGTPCKRGHVVERRVSTGNCPECQRAWRRANPERATTVGRAWRRANPEKVAAWNLAWRLANLGKARADVRAWQRRNQDKARAAARAWRKANPELVRARRRLRYARRRAAGRGVTVADIRRLWAMQRGKCAYYAICGRKLLRKPNGYHLDHIVPISRGGENDPKNVQLTCPACNLAKSDRDPLAHSQGLGFLL